MNLKTLCAVLLAGSAGIAGIAGISELAAAQSFDDSPALPERIVAGSGQRQRALPEHFAAITRAAWELDSPLAEANGELIAASGAGRLDAVKTLLADGAQANEADASGQRPLLAAAAAGHGETVRLLLQAGASPNVKGLQGRTPLGLAAAAGQSAIVRQLLRAGADVDARSDNRSTALHEAIRFDHPEVVGALLAAHPDPRRYDREGLHPLALAAARGTLTCLQALLDAGVEADLPDRTGLTALYWARRYNQPLAESLLVAHGAAREAWPIAQD